MRMQSHIHFGWWIFYLSNLEMPLNALRDGNWWMMDDLDLSEWHTYELSIWLGSGATENGPVFVFVFFLSVLRWQPGRPHKRQRTPQGLWSQPSSATIRDKSFGFLFLFQSQIIWIFFWRIQREPLVWRFCLFSFLCTFAFVEPLSSTFAFVLLIFVCHIVTPINDRLAKSIELTFLSFS